MPIFITINGILLNAADIQLARVTLPNDKDGVDGTRVYFINGGHTIIPDITPDQLLHVLNEAIKAAAPF